MHGAVERPQLAVTSAPTTQTDAASASVARSRTRLIAARVLLVLATILAVVSLLAGYVRYQALDTSTVEDTAAELISNDAIRTEIAGELVDQLYANVDVTAALQQRLPAGQQRLAAPLAGALRQLSDTAATRKLDRPRVQATWTQSVGAAHEELLRLLDDRGRAIRTTGGVVVLDLRPLVIELGNRIAIVGNLGQRLPANAGQVEIMKSDDLRTAQRAVHLLDILGRFLWIVTLGIAALAVWLAAGQRRTMLRSVAIGMIIAGLLVLAVRRIAGHRVVDALTPPGSSSTALADAWNILTGLLVDGGRTLVGVGVVALVGVWLAGDTHSGRASRRELSPWIVRWEIAFGAAAAFLLLMVWWAPTVQFRRVQVVIGCVVLLGLGIWALRRLTLREHPHAAEQPTSAPLHRAWGALRPQSPPTSGEPR